MSMFHSVAPERHGVSTNTYMPMVRPINGLFEQINNAGANPKFFIEPDFVARKKLSDIMGGPTAREWE